MKKFLFGVFYTLVSSIFFCSNAFGQLTYNDLIKSCYKIDIEEGEFYISGGNEFNYDIYDNNEMASLINKDVFGFFGLNNKYKTDLQKRAFSQTDQYEYYMSSINYHHSYLFKSKFYILYNLRYNNAYDINKRCFPLRISTLDYDRTKFSNYIGFGDNICASFPTNNLEIERARAYNGEIYSYQYIDIPISDTDLALKIETDMDNPYCSTYLMFVVEIDKVSTEQPIDFPIIQDYILTNTVNLYIVNTKEKKILCDLSRIL